MIIEHNPDEELNNESSPSFGPIDPDSDPDSDTDHKPDPDGLLQGGKLRIELHRISRLVDELDMAMTCLPHVEESGGSECPFAEDLYAQKEELEGKVVCEVEKMHSCIAELEHQIQRYKGNLTRIQTDSGKLNLEETQECYSDAMDAQEKQIRQTEQDIDAVSVVLAKAEAVLKVSQKRNYPGGKPQRQNPFPPSQQEPSQPSVPLSQPIVPDISNDGVDGLISLGPL